MEGIISEEENRPDNVGSIAGAAKTNVYALSKQDNTTPMDSQDGCESLPIPPPEDKKKNPQLPNGCLPEDKELMQSVKGFKDGKKIEALYNASGIYGKGDRTAHRKTLCEKLAFYTGNNAAQ